ncbi:MAG: NTP transferase domain-containing protein [Lachnospiraceae bacterium]|nr:NTP transferase domain-containing protein [Lachnospiraceae bacterium]
MNKQEADVLKSLFLEPFINQRILADLCGHSLGVVNRSLKNLISEGYLDEQIKVTTKAKSEMALLAPKNAVILAAGFGMRMVPINTQSPKALLEVNGETIIERTIKQLHEIGVTEIYVVVGFMKEQFEYLIDEYGVELVVNEHYAEKNNLHSLNLVADHISNTYIIPCDIWCMKNPYSRNELYSWYLVNDLVDDESMVRVNRKMELAVTSDGQAGNMMVGISYLAEPQATIIRDKLKTFDKDKRYEKSFWEEVLIDTDRMIVYAKVAHSSDTVEINTFEQLRELDENSNNLKSDAIEIIAVALQVNKNEIVDINILKKGMTNRSFLFSCRNQRYIMRIPGEGTDLLIKRDEEAAVYDAIKDKDICDDIVYINPLNGYKITKYLESSRVCDSDNEEDLVRCMKKLRDFHSLNLKVGHKFDIFKQIDFYESLWDGAPSAYRDYNGTKIKVFELKEYIDNCKTEMCLTHIDAVPDNFLFTADGDIRLIDWEYAGMQDPHVDIAMFCIYALYDRSQVDRLIDIYFENNCEKQTRLKIYCYIAACGLLWSNWCEYKRSLGVEFGEYSLRQYRYAKEYYKIFKEEYDA